MTKTSQTNPWLNIPLSDYEGHMDSAEVQQLSALSDLFAQALDFCRPASVAILGIAGGNGLDRIDTTVTKRIVGLDLNPKYLDVVRQRYSKLSGLELHCLDLSAETVALEPAQLVHAALFLEHAGVTRALENAILLVTSGGALSVVLQLPSDLQQGVSPTAFSSMQTLKSHFSLIDIEQLRQTLEARGFHLMHQAKRTLPAGKAFWLGIFHRA